MRDGAGLHYIVVNSKSCDVLVPTERIYKDMLLETSRVLRADQANAKAELKNGTRGIRCHHQIMSVDPVPGLADES